MSHTAMHRCCSTLYPTSVPLHRRPVRNVSGVQVPGARRCREFDAAVLRFWSARRTNHSGGRWLWRTDIQRTAWLRRRSAGTCWRRRTFPSSRCRCCSSRGPRDIGRCPCRGQFRCRCTSLVDGRPASTRPVSAWPILTRHVREYRTPTWMPRGRTLCWKKMGWWRDWRLLRKKMMMMMPATCCQDAPAPAIAYLQDLEIEYVLQSLTANRLIARTLITWRLASFLFDFEPSWIWISDGWLLFMKQLVTVTIDWGFLITIAVSRVLKLQFLIIKYLINYSFR